MNLSVKNIGKISHADITINGITVLAGLNGTGKTSVCRALYAALATFANIDRAVEEQRIWSIDNSFYGVQRNEIAMEMTGVRQKITNYIRKKTTKDVDFNYVRRLLNDFGTTLDTQIKDLIFSRIKGAIARDKQEYINFIAAQNMSRAFNDQIEYLGSVDQSVIEVSDGKATIKIGVRKNDVLPALCTMLDVERPIYVEAVGVLDMIQDHITPFVYRFLLQEMRQRKGATLEEFEAYKANRDAMDGILKDVTHGRLDFDKQGGYFVYREDGINEPINVHNIASGLKLFLMLQRFVENGTLNSKRVLIIDEPEVSLHPEWQIKLAKVLVLMHKQMGVRILLSTHSFFFLRAIEVYVKKMEVVEATKYYMTKWAEDGLYTASDVTGDTSVVYNTMYMPLEALEDEIE